MPAASAFRQTNYCDLYNCWLPVVDYTTPGYKVAPKNELASISVSVLRRDGQKLLLLHDDISTMIGVSQHDRTGIEYN